MLPLSPSQRRAVDIVGGRLEDATSADPVPQDHGLVPVGDSGFYVTPYEPVDPRDCARWPNSPYCQGDGFNPLEIVGGDIGISSNDCETCVTIQPTVLYIYGPTYTVCYRAESCRPAPPPPPSDISDGGNQYQFPAPQAPPGYCRVVYAGKSRSVWLSPRFYNSIRQCYGDRGPVTTTFSTGMGPDGVFVATDGGRLWDSNYLVVNRWASARMEWDGPGTFTFCAGSGSTRPEGGPFVRTFFLWRDFPEDGTPPADPGGIFPPYGFLANSCKPSIVPPPPFYPDLGDDMGCNCDEQEELLRAIYTRLGCEQFPIKVPSQLAGRTGNTTELPDFANVFAWWVYQMDSLIGEWPVEVEIEDDDPLQEGDQRKRISLPNIAETMAELFGLAYKNDTRGDIDTEILLRMVAELISTKNAALITQDYAKANASFLGYKGNPKKRKIDYAFDPSRLDSLSALMKESEQYITGWADDDDENVVAYLQRIMFAAGIIKAAFMRDANQGRNWIDSIKNLAEDALNQDSEWNDFVQRLKDPQDPLNRGAIPKPDARNVPGG